MITIPITYEKLDGTKTTEDFHFHLNKAELTELKVIHGDGLEGLMKTLNVATDGETIMKTFREIIALAVGIPSEDGITFEKPPAFVNRFMNSDAYSETLMYLLGGNKMAEFTIGILPKDLQDEARKRAKEQGVNGSINEHDRIMAQMKEIEAKVTTFELNQILPNITVEEILTMPRVHFDKLDAKKMTSEQLQAAYQRKSSGE